MPNYELALEVFNLNCTCLLILENDHNKHTNINKYLQYTRWDGPIGYPKGSHASELSTLHFGETFKEDKDFPHLILKHFLQILISPHQFRKNLQFDK